MPGQSVRIIADDRERNSEVLRVLVSRKDVDLVVRRMPVGDYLVDDRIMIERKTVADFRESIKDGRLFRQAIRLASASKGSALVVEGDLQSRNTGGLKREAVIGSVVSLVFIIGVPVLFTADAHETAGLIRCLARQTSIGRLNPVGRRGKRPRHRRRLQLHMLQGLPGIGVRRAEMLLRVFGSVRDVMNAEMSAIAALPGFGSKTAQRIREAVTARA